MDKVEEGGEVQSLFLCVMNGLCVLLNVEMMEIHEILHAQVEPCEVLCGRVCMCCCIGVMNYLYLAWLGVVVVYRNGCES